MQYSQLLLPTPMDTAPLLNQRVENYSLHIAKFIAKANDITSTATNNLACVTVEEADGSGLGAAVGAALGSDAEGVAVEPDAAGVAVESDTAGAAVESDAAGVAVAIGPDIAGHVEGATPKLLPT